MQTLKRKLSSRKLWAAVGAWATSLLTAFNVSESVLVRVPLIISGIGALIVYILAETRIDAARASAELPDWLTEGDGDGAS